MTTFTNEDAQRLLSIVDERIDKRLRKIPTTHYGVVASRNITTGYCAVYLFGDTVNTSEGFRFPSYMVPEVGDTVRVRLSLGGARYLEQIVHTANPLPTARMAANLTVDGNVTQTRSAVECSITSSQSISAATTTSVLWPTELRDTNAYHSTVSNTNRFTAPFTGLYLLTATVMMAGWTGGGRMVFSLVDSGGTPIYTQRGEMTTAGTPALSIAAVMAITAADWVEFTLRQESGASVNITSGRMFMTHMGV